MKRKDWFWSLKRLAKQIKDENEAMKNANQGTATAKPKGMRYLGQL